MHIHPDFGQLEARIADAVRVLGIDVPLISLFQYTRLDDFAWVVLQHQALSMNADELSRLLTEIEDLPDEEVERQLDQTGKGGSEG